MRISDWSSDVCSSDLAYNNGGGGNGIEVERIDASGDVVVRKGNESARGSVAIYDLTRRTITMIGNVQLTQGTNRLTGGSLRIDRRSGRSTVDGQATATGVSNEGSRITGTLTSPQREQ